MIPSAENAHNSTPAKSEKPSQTLSGTLPQFTLLPPCHTQLLLSNWLEHCSPAVVAEQEAGGSSQGHPS